MAGIFQAATAVIDGRTRVAERFRSGEGVGWHEHHDGLFSGTERSFGANYRVHLVSEWLPALTGIVEETGTRRRRRRRRLRPRRVDDPHGAGLPGLDVHRHSTPNPSRSRRPARAQDAGVSDRVRFEVADTTDYVGSGYDLIAFLDTLHDLGDPVAAASHARAALADDGACTLVSACSGSIACLRSRGERGKGRASASR